MRNRIFGTFAAIFRSLFGTRVAAAIWHIPGAHQFYEWLMPRLRPDRITVDGHMVKLDRMDSLLLSINGNYEADEQALFVRCLRPGDTVLDIGAHIGLYTLQAARTVGPTGRVVAFEPSTENCAILIENIATNAYDVEVVEAAVGERAEMGALALSSANTGDHSLLTDRTVGRPTEVVTVTTIDNHLAGQAVDVVKMDIQGGEPAALRGAARTLARSESVVLFTEVSPEHLPDVGEYVRQLEDLGFVLFEIDDGELVRRTVDDFAARSGNRGVHWDLVCAKGDGARERLGL